MQTIEQLVAKYQGNRINSIDDLKPIIKEIQELRIFYDIMENYRGHSIQEYKLNCGLARYKLSATEFNEAEKNIFHDFSNFASPDKDYIRQPFDQTYENPNLRNKWYSLFQAQHIGLTTRFMDWSIDWQTALMFAVENEKYFGKNGSFTVFFVPGELLFNHENISKISSKIDPFELTQDMMVNTPIYMFDEKFDYVGEKRISRQSGRFWVQSAEKSIIPLKEQPEYRNLLLELIIDGESKQNIKAELESEGATIDWRYYRKDEDVDEAIKSINSKYLKKP